MNGPVDAELRRDDHRQDGTTLAVTDFYNDILFFDARTYDRIGAPLELGSWVNSITYNPRRPRRSRTAAAGTSGSSTPALVRTSRPPSVEGRATHLQFTQDGSKLVVMTESASIYARDGTTLKPIGAPLRLGGFAPSFIQSYFRPPQFALTPDGRFAVTASDDGLLTW